MGILCVSVGCAHSLQQMLGTSQAAANLCSKATVPFALSPAEHEGFTQPPVTWCHLVWFGFCYSNSGHPIGYEVVSLWFWFVFP